MFAAILLALIKVYDKMGMIIGAAVLAVASIAVHNKMGMKMPAIAFMLLAMEYMTVHSKNDNCTVSLLAMMVIKTIPLYHHFSEP